MHGGHARHGISDGAKACGLNACSLARGKVADIVLLRKDDPSVFPFTNPAGAGITV